GTARARRRRGDRRAPRRRRAGARGGGEGAELPDGAGDEAHRGPGGPEGSARDPLPPPAGPVMRLLRRFLLAALALALLAGAALALWLPRYVASPQFDARLRAAASSAIGREVGWRALSVGLIPPRVIASDAHVGAGDTPALQAERGELRLALLPPLSRTLLADSLALDGLSLQLVRGAAGIEWGEPAAVPAAAPAAASREPRSEGSRLALAVRSLRIASARIAFTDRTVAP